MTNTAVERRLIQVGLYCGLVASILFPLWSAIKLPMQLNLFLHFAFGPLLVVAFMAIQTFLKQKYDSVSNRIGAVFGAIAGVVFCCMTVVQASNLQWIRDQIANTSDQSIKEELQRNLVSVFSVQLGLDIVWDIFITVATVLMGIAILRLSKFATLYGVLGIVVGSATLFLNLYTFPVPPREANLLDLGPFVGAWFFGLTVYLLITIKRQNQTQFEV
jgi:hypothetical protein